MLTKGYLGATTIVGGAAIALAVLIMLSTTPTGIGPVAVTGWFLLVLVGLSCLSGTISYLVSLSLQPKRKSRQRIIDAARRGLFVGGFATTMLAMSSLEQLNLRDAALLLLLIALVEFYTVARS